MKILIVEDDAETARWLCQGLREHGHAVDLADNGRDGLFLATSGHYDVAVIDRMLPVVDGLAIVRTLRQSNIATPILLLTALSETRERVEGLEAGADDYLGKPFAFTELHARLQALARRPPLTQVDTLLHVDDLEMDVLRRTVTRRGQRIELQAREFQLLEYLLRHAGKAVTRTMLLEQVWEFHFDPKTSVVETHISRLRAKLDRGHERTLIHTVRGVGYCLRASA